MPLRGREDEQPPRLHLVLGSATPGEEHVSEAALRVSSRLTILLTEARFSTIADAGHEECMHV